MELLTQFARYAPNRFFVSLILGAISGLLFAALIPLVLSNIKLINQSESSIDTMVSEYWFVEISNFNLALLFMACCLIIFFAKSVSEMTLVRIGLEVSQKIRKRFYERISVAPLDKLENVGFERLLGSINIDIPKIIGGAAIYPGVIVNLVTLAGVLGFLAYLNVSIFKAVVISIIIGLCLYQIPFVFGKKYFFRSRQIQDNLQVSVKDLIFGIKELKLNHEKFDIFYSDALSHNEKGLLSSEKMGNSIFTLVFNFGNIYGLFLIGAVSFIFLNYAAIEPVDLFGVVMVLLYIVGPIGVISDAIPKLAIARVAYLKVQSVMEEVPAEKISRSVSKLDDWRSVSFKNITYQYQSKDNDPSFCVGPLSFDIKRGEVTFITGSNGSGKSTLSKLITALYIPTSGEICIGDQVVTNELVHSYRQEVAAIYSNFHLFSQLYLPTEPEREKEIAKYLEELHLSDKVVIENGEFSTVNLSDGQKKRLALLVTYLENKNIYLFDEWAADQDPEFKKVFYESIVPALKLKDKAVIVISHDDSYYHLADKLIVMKQGEIQKN